MRSLVAPLILSVAGCAASGTDSTQTSTVRPACNLRTNCFNQRAVRNVRVLNDRSMVVFVGSANCPYLVGVDGFFCNLRRSAYIGFQDFDGQICDLDRSYVVGDPFAREDDVCEVRSVEPLNDDELVEILAAHGIVEPLPATGSGELEVIKTAEDEEAGPAAAPAPPAGPESVPADVAAETG